MYLCEEGGEAAEAANISLLWSTAFNGRHLHHRQRLGSHGFNGERVLLHSCLDQLRELQQIKQRQGSQGKVPRREQLLEQIPACQLSLNLGPNLF